MAYRHSTTLAEEYNTRIVELEEQLSVYHHPAAEEVAKQMDQLALRQKVHARVAELEQENEILKTLLQSAEQDKVQLKADAERYGEAMLTAEAKLFQKETVLYQRVDELDTMTKRAKKAKDALALATIVIQTHVGEFARALDTLHKQQKKDSL